MEQGVPLVSPPQFIDTSTRRVLPVRVGKPVACVIHTTGETDLDKILRFYQDEDGLQPHYMIEIGGTVRRIVGEDHIAYHCKIDPHEARLYSMGPETWRTWDWHNDAPRHLGIEATNYAEWFRTWEPAGLKSPLELVTGDHPNSKSVGIELQQPSEPTKDIFTDEQYSSLAFLLNDVAERNGIAISRSTVLGHYDCSPMRRSTARGNWDPGAGFNWMRLWDELPKRPRLDK